MPREAFGAKVMRTRLAKAGRGPTIVELLIIRAGAFKAGQLMLSLNWWVKAVHKYGERAGADQLAEMAKVSSRMGARYLAELRDALGDEDLAAATRFMLDTVGPQLDRVAQLEGEAARSKVEAKAAKAAKEQDRLAAQLAVMQVPGVSL